MEVYISHTNASATRRDYPVPDPRQSALTSLTLAQFVIAAPPVRRRGEQHEQALGNLHFRWSGGR